MKPTENDVVGHRITKVRWLERDEMEALGWEGSGARGGAVALELDNGILVAMQDPEGNGPGALHFSGVRRNGVVYPNQRRP